MTPSAPAVSGTAADPDAELRALIERIAQRDEAALRTLYERTSPRLFGLAMRVLRQRDTAEDVLQESFFTVWRVAVDYRASLSPPLAWLGLIVRATAGQQVEDPYRLQRFFSQTCLQRLPVKRKQLSFF